MRGNEFGAKPELRKSTNEPQQRGAALGLTRRMDTGSRSRTAVKFPHSRARGPPNNPTTHRWRSYCYNGEFSEIGIGEER